MNKVTVFFALAIAILLFNIEGCATRECIKEKYVDDTFCVDYDTKRGYCRRYKTVSKPVCEEYED